MGRSRAVPQSPVEDPNQSRSKRKRTASNVENLEPPNTGQGMSDGKKALYHCNYCNKDISGKIRIKCAFCPDFDLCVECFSVGAEVSPHKSNHPYRVMDNLSFPLFCPDWNADEEILLIEGIEMYGLGNWAEVAEHVGTKSKTACIDHYNEYYMNSPCFPLPDMSHVMGKNREELLAMAKELGEVKKGTSALGEGSKEEPSLSARVKIEDQRKEGSAGRSSSTLSSEVAASVGVNSNTSTGAVPSASQNKDGFEINKVEEGSRADRSVGEKKPRTSGEDGPAMTELSGYNFKRQEFEVEYDNDAEQLLADMEFKDSDSAAEREIKLRILHIYGKRLDERKRRKDFILERGLLYPDPFEMSLSPEEKEICKRYRVFMRLHSKEEHQELLRILIEEHRILKRIQDLQEARAAGCRTSAQAERYIEHKRKREEEENARRVRDSAQAAPNGKFLQRASHLKGESESSPRGNPRGTAFSDSLGKDSSSTSGGQGITSSFDNWDVDGFPGADLLSDIEKRLCSELRILPAHYLSMMQAISMGMLKGTISSKTDAYSQFTGVEPSKVDRVYEMALKKGFSQSYAP